MSFLVAFGCDDRTAIEELAVRDKVETHMPANHEEIARREAAARAHINAVYGMQGDEYGVTLFVSHHLTEIEPEYWEKHTGTESPEPRQVLEMLVLRSHWGEEDDEGDEEGIDMFDFTLPDNTTQYVICVEFDDAGNIVGVSMES